MMILVNLLGLGLIVFIVWWFWLHQPRGVRSQLEGGPIRITVADGVYEPSVVEVAHQTPSQLEFLRIDASPCADAVLFPELNINETLVVNKKTLISLPPLEKGNYAFHCQMQMYRGTLRVV